MTGRQWLSMALYEGLVVLSWMNLPDPAPWWRYVLIGALQVAIIANVIALLRTRGTSGPALDDEAERTPPL